MNEVKNIPFFNYQSLFLSDETNYIDIIKDIGSRGAYIMQSDLANFEQSMAAYTGSNYAVGVANATDGLQMVLMAGGIKAGDEVIFCSHTMVATASAIHFTGATPVPVDAGQDLLIDPDAIEPAITQKTRAIVVTQLNGRTANMDKIQVIANKYNLDIYEDAAQALGSKFHGKCAGTFGVGACISFYPAKILGCLGDGGLILCQDESIYKKLLLLRDHGRCAESGDVLTWGFNSRLDNLQAAILNHNFKNYDDVIKRRREIASIYHRELSGMEQLRLPPPPDYSENAEHFDVFQNYEIQAESRDDLRSYLSDNGIGTLIQWGGKAVHQFKSLGFTQELPKTELLFKRILMLPMNMTLSDEDVIYVCNIIREFYV